jgi:hypothetical protein
VLIIVGTNARDLGKYFDEVTQKAEFRDEYVQPMYNRLPVFVVRKPGRPLLVLWPHVKKYI